MSHFDPLQPRDEKGRWTDSVSAHFTSDAKSDEFLKRVFSVDIHSTDGIARLSSLLGCLGGETVTLSYDGKHVDDVSNYEAVRFETSDLQDRYALSGLLKRRPIGKSLFIESMYVQQKSRGLGTTILSTMVDSARAESLDMLELTAERSDDGFKMNGYYTWARLGFDGRPSPDVTDLFDLEFGVRPRKVSEIVGRDAGWWKQNGDTFDGIFDLKDGSRSMTIFNAYRARKTLVAR